MSFDEYLQEQINNKPQAVNNYEEFTNAMNEFVLENTDNVDMGVNMRSSEDMRPELQRDEIQLNVSHLDQFGIDEEYQEFSGGTTVPGPSRESYWDVSYVARLVGEENGIATYEIELTEILPA